MVDVISDSSLITGGGGRLENREIKGSKPFASPLFIHFAPPPPRPEWLKLSAKNGYGKVMEKSWNINNLKKLNL